MSTPTSGDEPVRRIALVAERRLVGQAISAALQGRGLAPVLFEWPDRGGRPSFRQAIARSGASVGVILCDLRTPDLLHDVEVLVSRGPIRWLVLTDSDFGPRWGTVLAAGAAGVLPTTTTTAGLAQAIRDTLAGRSPTPDVLRERAIREWEGVADEQRTLVRRMELLTHREYEVLGSLYDGQSVQRIASASGVAEATVRSQVKSLRRKLGVDSQLAAVAMYRRALEVFPRSRV
jgi:DNA-binding NarL/FixJ family response regulator